MVYTFKNHFTCIFFNIFTDYAITVGHFSPFTPLHPAHHLPPTSTPYIPLCRAHPFLPTFPCFWSCSWVIHISSLASTFPILFLPSPYLFSTYHLCYLFSVPFPPLSHSHSPVDNPPCDLHFCGPDPVVVACFVWFCFCF